MPLSSVLALANVIEDIENNDNVKQMYNNHVAAQGSTENVNKRSDALLKKENSNG